MQQIEDKINRIRSLGYATLKLQRDCPFFLYNGNTFKVDSLGKPSRRCRVKLIVKHKKVNFSISDVR